MADEKNNKHAKVSRETEAWYKDLVEHARDLVQCVDSEGRLIYVNQAWLATLNYSPEEIANITLFDIIHPDSMEHCMAVFKHVLMGKAFGELEAVFVAKDGAPVMVEGSVNVKLDDNGRFEHTRGIFRDVTERKRAENVNRLLVDISNAVVTVQNLDDLYQSIHTALGRVMDVTNFFIAIVDMQKRTLYFPYHVDTEDDDFLPITDFDPLSSLTGLVVSERQPVLYKREELDKRAQKGGVWGPLPQIWMGTPLMIEDVVIGIVAVQSYTNPDLYSEQDLRILSAVSDQMASAIARKRAEEELLALKNFNERIIQTIQEGIIISDLNGTVTFANLALLKMLGYSSDEFIGSHWTYIVPPQYHALIEAADARRLEGKADRYELIFKHKNGTLLPFQVSGNPHYNYATGEIDGTMAVLTDITERRRDEENLRISEETTSGIIDSAPFSIQLLDPEGYTVRVNQAFVELFGLTPPPDYTILSDPNFDSLGSHLNQMLRLAKGERVHFPEYYYNTRLVSPQLPDNPLWIRAEGFPLLDNNGNVKNLVLIHENITERKRAEEALQQEKAFQAILLDLAAGFINVPLAEFDKAIDDMLKKIGEFTGLDRVYLFRHDNRRRVTSNTHEWCREGITPEIDNLQDIPFDFFSDMLKIWEKGQYVYIPSVIQMPKEHPMRSILAQQGIQSLILIPLMRNQVNTGFVGFDAVNEWKSFSEQEITLLRLLAEIIANAFTRKRAEQELAERLAFEEMLSKISSYFVALSAEQFDERVYFALQTVGELYDVDRSYVYRFSEDGKTYSNTHLWCRDGVEGYFEKNHYFPVEQTPWWINELQGGRRVNITDVAAMPEEAALDKADFLFEEIKSITTLPLVWDGRVFGCFGFDTVKEHRAWTEEQLNLLQVVAELIAGAIARHDADRQIRLLSYHDQLTGLYNRHFLEEEMKRLDTERQLPISIIMADLNGLKLVNDTYGHQTGDEMLKRAAEVLKTACRSEDILARFGGDEFVLYLPRTTEAEAQKISARIEEACRSEKVSDMPLSLSMGVAIKVSAEQELYNLFKEAEDRLYQNKLTESRNGKSAIVNTLLQTLAAKSFETETHTRNMQEVAQRIGEKLGLPASELRRLNLLITLHDIGKISIPEELLNKKEALTDAKWEVMKKHSETGFRIVRATEEFAHVAEDILAHHERWDGSGYPQGLKGDKIPLLARITAIADAYEVMCHGRPYKKAMRRSEIVAEFKNCSGAHFDPKLVEVFLSTLEGEGEGEGVRGRLKR